MQRSFVDFALCIYIKSLRNQEFSNVRVVVYRYRVKEPPSGLYYPKKSEIRKYSRSLGTLFDLSH